MEEKLLESGTGKGGCQDAQDTEPRRFCKHCEALLEKRTQDVLNQTVSEISLSHGPNPSENGSESTIKLPHQQPTMASKIISTPNSVCSKQLTHTTLNSDILLNDGLGGTSSVIDNGLSEEQKEHIRFSQVGRKKGFVHMERSMGNQ